MNERLTLNTDTLRREPYGHRRTHYWACTHSAVVPKECTHVCLHDVSAKTLLSALADDCRFLTLTRGDCHACSHFVQNALEPSEMIEHKVAAINERLHKADLSGINVHWLDERSWSAERALSLPLEKKDTGRRGFLRGLMPLRPTE